MQPTSKLTKLILVAFAVIATLVITGYNYFQINRFHDDLNITNTVSPQHTDLPTTSQVPKGGNFTLQSAQGEVSLTDYAGKWVIVYFGYTFCPDICPTNLANLSMAYQQLNKKEQEKVQLILISVDPNRDTPARLKEYVDYFNSDMIGLTGEKTKIDRIVRQYGAAYHIPPHEADNPYYVVDHSGFSYVVNPEGTLTKQLAHATSAEDIVTFLRRQWANAS